MRYNGLNFEEVMAEHEKWANDNCTEPEAHSRADFSFMDIDNIEFSNIQLTRVNFESSYLENVIFDHCRFNGAIFTCALFRHCAFIDCTIDFSTFSMTHFYNNVVFKNCLLSKNSFIDASFSDTVFENCREFSRSIWYGADLDNAVINSDIFIPMACPASGSFIGWKKCYGVWKSDDVGTDNKIDRVLVKLEIPEDAERSSATTHKCRCSSAKVLDILNIDGEPIRCDNFEAVSSFDPTFKYKIGDVVKPSLPFEPNRFVECGSGIHFFTDRNIAVSYNMA